MGAGEERGGANGRGRAGELIASELNTSHEVGMRIYIYLRGLRHSANPENKDSVKREFGLVS